MMPLSKRPYNVYQPLSGHVEVRREDMMMSTPDLLREIEELAEGTKRVLEKLQQAQDILHNMVFGSTFRMNGPVEEVANAWSIRYRKAKRYEEHLLKVLNARIIRILSLLCAIAQREDKPLRL